MGRTIRAGGRGESGYPISERLAGGRGGYAPAVPAEVVDSFPISWRLAARIPKRVRASLGRAAAAGAIFLGLAGGGGAVDACSVSDCKLAMGMEYEARAWTLPDGSVAVGCAEPGADPGVSLEPAAPRAGAGERAGERAAAQGEPGH